MHAPHPTILSPLYPPLAISYRNHQRRVAYFSHLAPLILIFLLKGRIKGRGAWPNRTQTHFRSHKHTARKNQRYRSSAEKLASSSRTPRSLFSHPQGVRAPPIGNRYPRISAKCRRAFYFTLGLARSVGGPLSYRPLSYFLFKNALRENV